MSKTLNVPKRRTPISSDFTRREFLIGGGAALLLGSVGCGSGGGSGESASSGSRTIEHKYGSTEVSGTLERIVTVGLTDHDAVLALGVKPVGVVEWYGEYPFATWPWAEDELGDAEPEVLLLADTNSQPNFEQVAALEPDLIIGQYTGITEEQYETLSEIAPTVAQSGEYPDFAMPWQVTTRRIGRALGRIEKAEELIAGVEARFARAREARPEFEGATAVLAQGVPGQYDVLSSSSPRGAFLTSLGFETPEKIAELIGDGGEEFVTISEERLDLLDADVMVWSSDPELRADLEENPLYRQLDVFREGRDVFVPYESVLGGALQWSTVLSLPFAIERISPLLAAAVDGDPETEVTK